jgi:hypothetical protein
MQEKNDAWLNNFSRLPEFVGLCFGHSTGSKSDRLLGILLPFFVYRIRNEAIKTNVLLEDIKRLLVK